MAPTTSPLPLVVLLSCTAALCGRLPPVMVVQPHHFPPESSQEEGDEAPPLVLPHPVQHLSHYFYSAPTQASNHGHHHQQQHANTAVRVFYQVGNSEEDLPECAPWAVCSKVDRYAEPWVERQCRCKGANHCSKALDASDGHTLTDKTRQYKLCEPIKKLPKCRFFRDITWTLRSYPDNVTEQVVHCHCPKTSVAYLIQRQVYETRHGVGYQYSFACSPQSRLRCQRKEPCRLFTVRKRPEVDEVNTNTLCQCPHNHRCPRHHTHAGVIAGKSYTDEAIRTYSGYCI
ncbi:protein giant-lens [Ischnura elegans]|uniref:protein giant-lens n=1 Tax=Ischnura elegans TaxID=197161 RepID=UPI001ED88CD1|nr:protein giant-lens [Ischnura elegans]